MPPEWVSGPKLYLMHTHTVNRTVYLLLLCGHDVIWEWEQNSNVEMLAFPLAS